jgi:PKD domain
VRRGLLLALTALLAAAPPALADVTVAPADGEPVTLSIAELEPSWDVREKPYTLRGPAGEQVLTVSGISIDRLLDRAGVDPFAYAGATVSLGDRSVTLARAQLTDPAAFPEGRPVFSADAEGTHFLRPVTGPGDMNEADRLSSAGEPITIALTATGRLRVSASASRRRIEAGQQISFSARVDGAAAGEDVRVRWTFDDGRSASGMRVRHRFARPGTYEVVVGATSDANPTGASAIVSVRVGEPDADAPDREGGGTDPDADAPDSGVAAGDETSGGNGGSGARERAPARRRARPRDRAAAQPAGAQVAGVLLEDPGSLPPVAARTGTPLTPASQPLDLPPEALAALAALALLALGAWRERSLA